MVTASKFAVVFASALLGAVSMIGCTSSTDASAPAPGDMPVASLRLGLVEADGFAGKSVLISGKRRVVADGKYPCLSQFEKKCLDFPGTTNDGDTTSDDAIGGLCPSANLGPATTSAEPAPWDFYLTLYDAPGCGGVALTGTDGTSETVCYERDSLGVAGTENRVMGELLEPGSNVNNIVCIVRKEEPTLTEPAP